MSERKTRKAEKILAGGRKRYVLLEGGLGWGLFVATGTSVWEALDKSGYTLSKVDWASFFFDWLMAIPVYFVGGCLWGLLMWEFFTSMKGDAREGKQK